MCSMALWRIYTSSPVRRSVHEKPETVAEAYVVAGDSFESIANKYGVTVRELVGANPQLLKTGEQLTVPAAAAIPSENGKRNEFRTRRRIP